MSIPARDWAWEQTLPTTVKLVLVALAERADNDGVCWPTLDRLMEMTGLSRPTIVHHLDELSAAGLLAERTRRGGTGSGRQSNVYRLNLAPAKLSGLTQGLSKIDEGAKLNGLTRLSKIDETPYIERAPAVTKPSLEPSMSSPPILSESTETIMGSAPPESEKERTPKTRPKVKPTSPLPPDLQAVCDRWAALGLGHLSAKAVTGLRLLTAEHGREWVELGLEKAATGQVQWPVSWLRTCIPAWKRESAGQQRVSHDMSHPMQQEGRTTNAPPRQTARTGTGTAADQARAAEYLKRGWG